MDSSISTKRDKRASQWYSMSIVALPPQAVHAIGSTQVLTDSASLVKELVDNAFDAQATSITIELSANALDVIQVKDNGQGIAPDDRALVCRRHCTSKIKDLKDLARIGGASLGFRGEALASAVEMSGSVIITTRIIGEATAVSLKVSRNGEVENEDRVSQAVGTTVRVTDFLRNLPVRRQTALKDSTKQLAKVKRTLQAYAFARPAVRLLLKVLKAKNDKENWTYAPKSDASVADAVIKILGKKVSDQCQWMVWTPDERRLHVEMNVSEENEQPLKPDDAFKVEALIPKPDTDPSVICNVGHFISVDSRPVSCTRGTLKQVVQLFKSYLKSSSTTFTNQKIVDPFLYMNIICPRGSYDANVEPAKDDVLFSNSSHIIDLMETLFRSHYGELRPIEKQTTSGKHGASKPRVFDLLLARKPPPKIMEITVPEAANSESSAPTSAQGMQETVTRANLPEQFASGFQEQRQANEPNGRQSPSRFHEGDAPTQNLSSTQGPQQGTQQTWHHSMYVGEDGEDPIDDGLAASQDSEDEEDLRDITATNPWTLAKTNASICPSKHVDGPQNEYSRNPQLMTPAKDNGDLSQDLSLPVRRSITSLPSPAKSLNATPNEQSSPDVFPYPRRAWGKAHREADTTSHESSSNDELEPPSGALDTWVQRTIPQRRAADQDLFVPDQGSDTVQPPRSGFVSASILPQGTPLSAIPDISQKPRRKPQQRASNKNINKPFTPPVRDLHRVWFDNLEPSSSSQRSQQFKRPRRNEQAPAADILILPSQSPPSPSLATSTHPGLALTMDYEKRKADAMAARRAFLRQQSQSQSHRPLSLDNAPLLTSSSPPTIMTSPSQPSKSSPHYNRYRAAREALHTTSVSSTATAGEAPLGNAIPQINPKDPRAYLMRIGKDRTRRVKTSVLPLETTSAGDDGEGCVRDLVQIIRTEGLVERIEKGVGRLAAQEEEEGGERDGFGDVGEMEVRVWEERVRKLAGELYSAVGREGEEGVEIEVFVGRALGGR